MAVQALRFVAYDGDDPNGSPVGELTESAGKFFDIEYNGTGGGELQVSRHSTQAHWSDPGAYIRVYLDSITTCRGAFWVTQSNDEILGADEDGIEVYRRQGNGPLYYLSDAIVWYEAVTGNDSAVPLTNTDVWEWTGPVHPGGILVRMLEEAIVRGCYPDLTYDFTRTTDSNGDPWTITIEEVFQLQVGQNMMEVVAKLQELGLVLVMDHDLVLHAYESVANSYVGRNLAATVTLTKGADIVDSAERQQVSASARSSTLVKGTRSDNDEIAWVPADSAAALSELGRRKEGFLDAGDATHFATLELMGLNDIYRKLRLKAGPTAISVTDPTATAKRALIDYTVGDQITVDIPGVFNAVAKPITSIQIREREAVRDALHEDTGYSDYDVVVGFDEDPARLELPPDIVAGPAGAPDSPCCPDEGPFVPPGGDEDCGIALDVTMVAGDPGTGFDFDQYASDQVALTPPTMVVGQQYKMIVDVLYNRPAGANPLSMDGPSVQLRNGTDPLLSTSFTWDDPSNPGNNPPLLPGYVTPGANGYGSDYQTGAHHESSWGIFGLGLDPGPATADVFVHTSAISGFYGCEWHVHVQLLTRNGDGSALVCDGTAQTAPHEGQTATEQAAATGTTAFTNFPYIAGSLHVWVGGVLVPVTETDPVTGEFTLPFDPASSPVVVQYQSTGGAATGATNPQPASGTFTIPVDLISIALDDVNDVEAPTPADGDILTWDPGTGAGAWIAAAPSVVTETLAATIIDAKGDIIVGTAADTPVRKAVGTNGQRLKADSGQTDGLAWVDELATIQFVIDGGGTALTTGVKGYLEVPFAWSDITAVRLLADQSGSVVVNIWKDTYANYPPVVGDKITASAPPTISTATKSEDTTLTGWTKTGSAGDILAFNVDSATTIQRVTVAMTVKKS